MTKENPISDDLKYQIKSSTTVLKKVRTLNAISRDILEAERAVSKVKAELTTANSILNRYYSEYEARFEELDEIFSEWKAVKGPIHEHKSIFINDREY